MQEEMRQERHHRRCTIVPRTNLRVDSISSQGQRYAHGRCSTQKFIPPALFGTTLALAYAQIVYTLTSTVFAKTISTVGVRAERR